MIKSNQPVYRSYLVSVQNREEEMYTETKKYTTLD